MDCILHIFAVGIPHPYIHENYMKRMTHLSIFLIWDPLGGNEGWRIRGRRAGVGVVEKGKGNRRV